MFRSSFHPIPPSPSSGIYITVASIKNDKEHLTWILLCRVQNVFLLPFTGRKKMKTSRKPTPLSISTFKELCLLWCLFSGEPMRVSAEPTRSHFSPLLYFLRATCQFTSAWVQDFNTWHFSSLAAIMVSLFSTAKNLLFFLFYCFWERSFDLDGYLASWLIFHSFSKNRPEWGQALPSHLCNAKVCGLTEKNQADISARMNVCPQAAGVGRGNLFADMDN